MTVKEHRMFVRYRVSTSEFVVKFRRWREASAEPKSVGFVYDVGEEAWKTKDPTAVARLAAIEYLQVATTDTGMAAFEALRPSLPKRLQSVVLVQTKLEEDLQAEDDLVVAEAAAEAARRAEASAIATAINLAARKKSEAKQAKANAQFARECREFVVRWSRAEGFSVRHGKRGNFCQHLCYGGYFAYDSEAGVWRSPSAKAAAGVAESVGSCLDTYEVLTAEAAAAIVDAGVPLGKALVKCSEADVDATTHGSTMVHLAGATPDQVEAAYRAVKQLAAWDRDHATVVNEVGFGKSHEQLGHKIASLDPAHRTPLTDAYAVKLARRHRRQLDPDMKAAIGSARA